MVIHRLAASFLGRPSIPWAIVLAGAVVASTAASSTERSRDVSRAFQQLHPCPATGLRSGRCPGYIRDHVEPLCNGGADSVENMQWQTVEEAAKKDRWERQLCASARRWQ